jgi:hypothetical protein
MTWFRNQKVMTKLMPDVRPPRGLHRIRRLRGAHEHAGDRGQLNEIYHHAFPRHPGSPRLPSRPHVGRTATATATGTPSTTGSKSSRRGMAILGDADSEYAGGRERCDEPARDLIVGA